MTIICDYRYEMNMQSYPLIDFDEMIQVLLSICSLLTDPNPEDPLVPEIAQVKVGTSTTKRIEIFMNLTDHNLYKIRSVELFIGLRCHIIIMIVII